MTRAPVDVDDSTPVLEILAVGVVIRRSGEHMYSRPAIRVNNKAVTELLRRRGERQKYGDSVKRLGVCV